MNIQLNIVRLYFKLISLIAPKFAGAKAFKLFQKVRIKSIRKREEDFYTKANHFKVTSPKEDINCYELGAGNSDIVFLLHGWESNAGSLSKFAYQLAENNYRVISFDLPGHAKYNSNYTNLAECKNAFTNVIKFVKPKKPFSVLSHSFGSAVSAYTLSNLNYKINKLVFLTSPNSILEIFIDFKKLIGLPSSAFSYLIEKADLLANEKIKNFSIDEKLKHFTFSKLLLIHDEYDKIIPFKNSKEIQRLYEADSVLIKHKKIGHYKMLWNQNVIDETLLFLKN
ncbi:alpha/beta fold hydrolase [Flavobacteriales bacterium]|nr:alpha/beta fold hydrolase [Flavobacteriales bacterium]